MLLPFGGAAFAVAADSVRAAGGGPSGAPAGGSFYTYAGGAKLGVKWRNTDATAYTRIYVTVDGGTEYLGATALPGVTQRDMGIYTGLVSTVDFRLVHYKNGQESADLNVNYPAGAE